MTDTTYTLALRTLREALAKLRDKAGNDGVLTSGIIRTALGDAIPAPVWKSGDCVDWFNARDDVMREYAESKGRFAERELF